MSMCCQRYRKARHSLTLCGKWALHGNLLLLVLYREKEINQSISVVFYDCSHRGLLLITVSTEGMFNFFAFCVCFISFSSSPVFCLVNK